MGGGLSCVGVKDSFENMMEHLREFIFQINYIKVYYDRAQHVTFPFSVLHYAPFYCFIRGNIARHVFYVPLKHEKKKPHGSTPSAHLSSGVSITKGSAHALMEKVL